MTPADLAAALGIHPRLAGTDAWGDPSCEVDGAIWTVDRSPLPDVPDSLRYGDMGDDLVIRIPITTTLKAAVARVRAMLAVEAPKENEP